MELDDTVDAIEGKLLPAKLAEEGWDKVKSSTQAGARQVVRMARENPIPLGLIGAGVTWLVIERTRRGTRERWQAARDLDDYGDLAAAAGGEYGKAGAAARAAETLRESVTSAKETALEATDRISELASQATARVSEVAHRARRRAGELAETVRTRAADLGRRTTEQAQRARDGVQDLIERRPLAAGVAAVAIGVLVGLFIQRASAKRR